MTWRFQIAPATDLPVDSSGPAEQPLGIVEPGREVVAVSALLDELVLEVAGLAFVGGDLLAKVFVFGLKVDHVGLESADERSVRGDRTWLGATGDENRSGQGQGRRQDEPQRRS